MSAIASRKFPATRGVKGGTARCLLSARLRWLFKNAVLPTVEHPPQSLAAYAAAKHAEATSVALRFTDVSSCRLSRISVSKRMLDGTENRAAVAACSPDDLLVYRNYITSRVLGKHSAASLVCLLPGISAGPTRRVTSLGMEHSSPASIYGVDDIRMI